MSSQTLIERILTALVPLDASEKFIRSSAEDWRPSSADMLSHDIDTVLAVVHAAEPTGIVIASLTDDCDVVIVSVPAAVVL